MVKSIILLPKFIKKAFTKIYNVSVKCSSNPVNRAPSDKLVAPLLPGGAGFTGFELSKVHN